MATWSETILYISLLVLFLNQQLFQCGKVHNLSEIRFVGELDNSTNSNVGNGKDIRGRSFLPSLNDAKSVTVFHQKNKKEGEPTQTKPSLLLKSTANDSSTLPAVGDGLDLAKPSILLKRSSPTVVKLCVGNQVTLKCAAEGNPAPDFTWYKNRQMVNRDKVAEFDLNIAPSMFTRASHLTLTPHNKEDFGDYECAASNTLGGSQQSTYMIELKEKGKGACAESISNSERQKYNSIIIGTISSVGMLLTFLFIAGFVFWRLNQQKADALQSLEKSSDIEASMDKSRQATGTSGQANQTASNNSADEDASIHDDFNAEEIGRLSMLLAGDWEKLARLLGFHQHDVTAIRGNSDRIESRCADMLNRFRKRRGSRSTLAESVEELNDIEIALAIRNKYYKSNPIE